MKFPIPFTALLLLAAPLLSHAESETWNCQSVDGATAARLTYRFEGSYPVSESTKASGTLLIHRISGHKVELAVEVAGSPILTSKGPSFQLADQSNKIEFDVAAPASMEPSELQIPASLDPANNPKIYPAEAIKTIELGCK